MIVIWRFILILAAVFVGLFFGDAVRGVGGNLRLSSSHHSPVADRALESVHTRTASHSSGPDAANLTARSIESIQAEIDRLLSSPQDNFSFPSFDEMPAADAARMRMDMALMNPETKKRLTALLLEVAGRDAAAAFAMVPHATSCASLGFAGEIKREIAKKHPKEIAKLFLRRESVEPGVSLSRLEVAMALAQGAPQEALSLALKPGTAHAAEMVAQAAQTMAESDLERTASTGLAIGDDILRAIFLKELFSQWENVKPDDFSKWLAARPDKAELERLAPARQVKISRLPGYGTLGEGVASLNARVASNFDPGLRVITLNNVISKLDNPSAALSLSEKIIDNTWKDEFLREAVLRWADKMPDEAAKLLPSIREPQNRSRSASTLAAMMTLKDVSAAILFASALPTYRERSLALASVRSTAGLGQDEWHAAESRAAQLRLRNGGQ